VKVIAACRHDKTRAASIRILAEMGLSAHQARSGQHAAEMLETCTPDVILLEADPSGREMEACRKIRTEQRFTGMIGVWVKPPYSAAEWLNNGVNAFLHHSSDDAVLITTMRSLLRTRNAERELAAAAEKIDRLQDALLRAQQEFHQFALRASHDFQESSRAITIFSQLIAEQRGASEDREREYLHHVAAGHQRMRALLDSILLYSQSASDHAATYGMVDLKSAVHGALKALQPAILESGARVEADPSLPVVWANLPRLQQVLQCLIANSIAYRRADRAPEVHISGGGQPAPGEWLICVRDNGIGIEKQYHEAIFAPFKRLHGREIPGSGLGLAVCRRIVEAHGGRIWVESSPEGSTPEGSTFSFTLREGPVLH